MRPVKFYIALGICILALYGVWIGTKEWIGLLSSTGVPLSAGGLMLLSLLGLGVGGYLGWRTILEELAVQCD